jgi:hypothetical protein
LIVLQALSAALYLRKTDQFGFPLDDAWIHQIYARNLGLHGVMAFNQGQPSTGSTSFGWTLLLAAGYWLGIPFFLWTYLWGSIFAVATACTAAQLSQHYFGDFRNAVIVAVISLLEWHLAWAAVSGMEIGLFTFLTLLFFLLLRRDTSPLLLAGLTGMIVLVRPEGILLALVYGIKLFLDQPRNTRQILRQGIAFLLVFLLLISPWIVFNLTYSHRPFPNTIAAKFMQYGYPWSPGKSLKYLWDVVLYFLNGPLVLLIPGAVFAAYQAITRRTTHLFYPFAWFLALIGLYAVALPAIYDQGRYLMPLIPLLVIYGVEGLSQLLTRFLRTPVLRSFAWVSLFGLVISLWINGAADYAYRIQLYSAVHIKAAEWINAHTSPDAVIATHDIGIIGYHTGRQIVDLAGLVTPEIVPIMRDPQKLADYLRTKRVSYLLLYTGYYRELLTALNAQLVFSPDAERLRAMGVEPFEVYEVSQ